MDVAVLAGSVSTALFVGSYPPMLLKAFRTKDLDSYSRGNLVLATIGNAVYSIYVFSLPFGPIWFLHTFYVVATLLMLAWHLPMPHPPARAATRREGLRRDRAGFAGEHLEGPSRCPGRCPGRSLGASSTRSGSADRLDDYADASAVSRWPPSSCRWPACRWATATSGPPSPTRWPPPRAPGGPGSSGRIDVHGVVSTTTAERPALGPRRQRGSRPVPVGGGQSIGWLRNQRGRTGPAHPRPDPQVHCPPDRGRGSPRPT